MAFSLLNASKAARDWTSEILRSGERKHVTQSCRPPASIGVIDFGTVRMQNKMHLARSQFPDVFSLKNTMVYLVVVDDTRQSPLLNG